MAEELLDAYGSLIKRGGARPGSGRRYQGYVKPDEVISYDKAKARKESAMADLHELDYKVKSGQYVSRNAVRQASATAMAALAQTIRSLPDHLERRGVPPSVCVQIDAAITEVLGETAKALEAIWRSETDDHPSDNRDLF
jgi:hypothetical protein